MEKFTIERFNRSRHERGDFCCGNPPMDEYLRTLVSQYEKRKIGTTYVAVQPDQDRVLGYYTLSSGSVPFVHLPPKIAKKLPRHPVPVVLLARLAVDQSVQGHGMGSDLLLDALHRIEELSESLGIFAAEVEAIDQKAKSFYLKFGFQPLLDAETHLFLPVTTIEKVFPRRK
jgi:GNAT superfamily N-acetyltransferase